MNLTTTPLEGLWVIEPHVFNDNRGYFFESYNQNTFFQNGIKENFVQDNQSMSNRGVLRGLHYQLYPHAQTKLVRVIQGAVFDVAVDLRKKSPTFGKWHGEILSAQNQKQMLIPKGFAHGFLVLENQTVFFYKCDAFYDKSTDRGIKFDDPEIGIHWNFNLAELIISEKDLAAPPLQMAEINF